MGKFLKLLVLRDIHKELGQTVENQLSLINEDIHLILEEFLAVILDLLWHCGTEKHHLFLVRRFCENILNVGSHTSGT